MTSHRLCMWIASLWMLATMAASVAQAQERSPLRTAESRSRFEATAAAYRKWLIVPPRLELHEREVVADVKFHYVPNARPKVDLTGQFGERRVTMTDRWYSAAEDLVLAAVVLRVTTGAEAGAQAAAGGGPVQRPSPDPSACFRGYVAALSSALRHNAKILPGGLGMLQPLPRYDAWSARPVCGVVRLKDNAINEQVAEGLSAGLNWLIGRELRLLILGNHHGQGQPDGAEAQRWSMDRAHEMRIDLLPGYPVVLLDALIHADAAWCATPGQALEMFFKDIGARRVAKPFFDGRVDLAAVERQLAAVWIDHTFACKDASDRKPSRRTSAVAGTT